MEMLDQPSWLGPVAHCLDSGVPRRVCCDDGYPGSEVTAPAGNPRLCFVAPDPDHDLYGRSDWTAIGCGARNRFGQRRIYGLALSTPPDAVLFSIDSMSTRGASGLTLQRHWQLMGALEAINGMLLFGVSTAWLFTVAQGYWWMIAEQWPLKRNADSGPIIPSKFHSKFTRVDGDKFTRVDGDRRALC